jgi:predicted RNA-binding Zn ribbon-like protein
MLATDAAVEGAHERTDIHWWTLDTIRAYARRWCGMAICGNRAKQATHRHQDAAMKFALTLM